MRWLLSLGSLLCLGGFVILVMVVPQMRVEAFERGRELAAFERLLFQLTAWCQQWGLIIVPVLLALMVVPWFIRSRCRDEA